MGTRLKNIGEFSLGNKDRDLTRTNDELRPVLDFVLVPRESPDERVPRIIEPLDDIDKLATNFVE